MPRRLTDFTMSAAVYADKIYFPWPDCRVLGSDSVEGLFTVLPAGQTLALSGAEPFAKWRQTMPESAIELALNYPMEMQWSLLQLAGRAPSLDDFIDDCRLYPLYPAHLIARHPNEAALVEGLRIEAAIALPALSALPLEVFAAVPWAQASVNLHDLLEIIWPRLAPETRAALVDGPLTLPRAVEAWRSLGFGS